MTIYVLVLTFEGEDMLEYPWSIQRKSVGERYTEDAWGRMAIAKDISAED